MGYVCRGAAIVMFVMTLVPAQAIAQTSIAPPMGVQQQVSANPFALMYQWFNAEYEHRAIGSSTWGASASFFSLGGDADYRNAAAFFRYYPQGRALHGFYIGGRAGAHRVSVDRESGAFMGLGFELGYNWLLGRNQNFMIGTGAGATRLFGGALNGASLTIPTVRLVNIGVAF